MSRRWRKRSVGIVILSALLFSGYWWGEELLVQLFWPKRDRDVIFAPTPPEAIDKMIELAAITKDDVVYDLGCGDGRILIQIAKKCGCKAVGWEIDPKLVADTKRNAEAAGVAHLVEVHQGDLFEVDLSGCSVLAIYLLPELNARLIPQLKKMKAGSRIVSYSFNMPGVKPKQAVTFRNDKGMDRTVYFWTTPLEME